VLVLHVGKKETQLGVSHHSSQITDVRTQEAHSYCSSKTSLVLGGCKIRIFVYTYFHTYVKCSTMLRKNKHIIDENE
jgi:hypothetical protein